MKKIKVLVTGVKGYVGSEIVRLFERECERVFTIENKKVRRDVEKLKDSDDAFAVDITDREAVLRLENIGEIDVIVHAAGLAHQYGETSREDFQRVNVDGIGNILELARNLGVKHFVLISSVSVYGHSKNKFDGRSNSEPENKFALVKSIDEEAICTPDDFYAESKLDGENLARRFCRENSIRLTILRLSTVIGEEDKGNLLRLIRLIDLRYFIWIGKGENHKSFVHREDVARACVTILASEKNESEIFNVSANSLKMRRVVEIVGGQLGKKIPNVSISATLVKHFFRLNSNFFNIEKIKRIDKKIGKWLADDVYSAEKIKRIYGFEPQISAEKAIEREVEWYISKK